MGPINRAAAPTARRASDVVHAHPARTRHPWQRIRSLRQCRLTAHTPYGEPYSCTLRVQNRSFHGGEPLWFFVERGSDLLLDIQHRAQVELEFTDRDGTRLVIEGHASIQGRLDEHLYSLARTPWRTPADEPDAWHRWVLLRVEIDEIHEHGPAEAANDPQLTPHRALA